MSGSLQVLGKSGTWSAQAANSTLGVGQTAMSVQLWVEVNSVSGTSPGDIFFLSSTSGFVFQINPGTNSLTAEMAGVSASFNYTKPIVIGKPIHFVLVFNSVGSSTVYVGGTPVMTGVNLGATSATAAGPKIGWLATGGGANFTLSDAAIWNGVALGIADIINLRDRVSTPATTSAVANSWWTLSGTAATNPVASAAGMLDQIGTNHFATIGGTSTNAVYSASDLTYASPLTVAEVYVSKNQLVTFFIGTNPLFGTALPSGPTALTANPVISINGTPTTPSALSPIWSPAGGSPCVTYHFTQTIAPTDVVTWKTVDSWVSNASGTAGPDSGTAHNYVGQLEPGVFNYLPFDLPDNQKTVKLGFNGNAIETASTSVLKNVVHRTGAPINGTGKPIDVTTTIDNLFPTAVDATGSVGMSIWNSNDLNGIDNNGFLTPVGTWTLIADETAHATPMVVSLNSFNGAGTGVGPTITPGTVSGSTETGKAAGTGPLLTSRATPGQWRSSSYLQRREAAPALRRSRTFGCSSLATRRLRPFRLSRPTTISSGCSILRRESCLQSCDSWKPLAGSDGAPRM